MAVRYKPAIIGVKYIDAADHILGRLASRVAKLALNGYEVHVVNAEKVVITGKKEVVFSEWAHKVLERGDWYKGPFHPKRPDRILRRVIRGMLPKSWRGRVALARVKTYIGIPDELKDKNFEKFEDCLIQERIKQSRRKIWYVTLKEVSKHLGAKIIEA
jgi:large subunit ribosomal protein L13